MTSHAVFESTSVDGSDMTEHAELATDFFILRGGKAHGPCSLEELRSYLAYGSMQLGDMVCRVGSTQWQQVHTLPELRPPEPDPEIFENVPSWLQWLRPVLNYFVKNNTTQGNLNLAPRRRVVRYRDYSKVPEAHRSGATASKLFWGFLFFPPRLWSASATVFSQRVYRNSADANGYLKTWPRWVEMLCAVMITVNALAWMLAIYWLVDTAIPIAHEALTEFMKATRAWWAELGTHPNA
jgi:GYF domain 2